VYPRTLLDADIKTGSERESVELVRAECCDELEVFCSVS
jgi:hypothetical protein